ncbi:hypothetical protein KIW84_052269 [Lathyrus oleraceus]|uniref:Uncharacterized protein n=1 Tax=Pisum sativum TaxID=3888 RepID=A0A9D4WM84_PEA|nr:hypothetical protein KIW84_052269 [Pisum sativum]
MPSYLDDVQVSDPYPSISGGILRFRFRNDIFLLCEANKQGFELRESRVHTFILLLGTRSKRMHWMDDRALRRNEAFRGERPWGDTICDPWISDRETVSKLHG